VHRVARERAQEHVIDHYVQRGQAADAIQAGEPLGPEAVPIRRHYDLPGCRL
jgi:hypothetical protein